jgi:periplasmic divalent cation tolerance protein
MAKPLVVFMTAPSAREARRIAGALVKEKHAACVNILPGVTSVYRWKGKVETAGEVLLVAKTTSARFKGLAARVRQRHSYEVPEIIAVPVAAGHKAYLDWVEASVKGARGES